MRFGCGSTVGDVGVWDGIDGVGGDGCGGLEGSELVL